MADVRKISTELAKKAKTELNEVEQRIPEDIASFREWIEKQPHLNARTNGQFLIAFLRGCKYSFEKAKQKFDYFHTFKSISPDIFLNIQLTERSLKLTRLGHLLPLPNPLKPDGPRIVVTRCKDVGLDEFSFLDHYKNQIRTAAILMLEDDNCVIGGLVNIIDFAYMPLSFFLRFDPVLMKKIGVYSDMALPIRVCGVHLINASKEALAILKVINSLLPKKVKGRMMVHSSIESLYEHVPKEYLPEEYGGNNGHISDAIDSLEKSMLKYKDYFEEDDQYKSNEKLRLGTKVSSESLFGLEGSFRKLEVD